ncbi:class IV adenylate cyclase [Myceligenerans halotolerans]
MIEAELKARVHEPEAVMRRLDERAVPRVEVYADTYYDRPDGSLEAAGRELRVRTIHGPDGTRTLLTYKGPVVDEASGSKPEHETRAEDPAAVHEIIRGLGYIPTITFEKRCRNYDLRVDGRRVLASLVRVPEIDGIWIEVETLAVPDDLDAALTAVRTVLADLGIDETTITRDLYTDAVRANR